jgi:uncharacterized protein (TIGR02722 family)
MKTSLCVLCFTSILTVFGCATETKNIDMVNDEGKAVLALDYRDFNKAASEMIQSMLSSGAVDKKEGGRYVMTTGRIVNDTMQRIDTDQLMAKIEEELLNSGKVVMTSAVGGKGAPDKMVYDVREIRRSDVADEFKGDTLPAKKQLISPELSIAGKIYQRNINYDKDKQQVEYYFQLYVTDLTTGLRFWQREVVIGKRGSNKSVAW